MSLRNFLVFSFVVLTSTFNPTAFAGEANPPKAFGRGVNFSVGDLPESQLKAKLATLPAATQGKALQQLKKLSFTAADVKNIRVGGSGSIFYTCGLTPEAKAFIRAKAAGRSEQAVEERAIAQAPVPIANPPVYHSRPGSARVIYLDFNGHVVTNTEWNDDYETPTFDALPFTLDTDISTFNDAEQTAIKRIWTRIAEDYAPFDVDVTTQQPAVVNNTVARVLITKSTDRTGKVNPDGDSAGGVAYVDVFGDATYASRFHPAWVYYDQLRSQDDFIAEAASHEVGHNLGLSHDGRTTPVEEYYEGHGVGNSLISWGPIMGTGYDRNVSQWSKGEYTAASNTEDDLVILTADLPYRTDDHGNSNATATPLTVVGQTSITSTTPENDSTNATPFNKGVIERNTDIDVFRFETGAGPVSISVNSWANPSFTRGGNLDIKVDMYNSNGQLVSSSDRNDQPDAAVFYTAQAGTYFLHIQGVGAGDPLGTPISGYTEYGSIGQYFISGTIQPVNPELGLPTASMGPADLKTAGGATHNFTVTYYDDVGIDVATLDSLDIRLTGPNGYNRAATFVSVNLPSNGSPRTVTYQMAAPGGTWDPSDNGTYFVLLQGQQVANTSGRFVAATTVGTIVIAINGGPPTAVADAATTGEAQPVTINVMANDIGNDPPYAVVILTQPLHGTVRVNADRTVTYTPTVGYAGPDSFVYAITDVELESSSATVTITVTPTAPVITSAMQVSALQGLPFSYTITVTGTQPLTISAAPLPAGTVLNGNVISGLIAPGSYAVTLSATNAAGNDTRTLVIIASGTGPGTDSDGDGFTDELEILVGSDPVNGGSTPLTALKNDAGEVSTGAGTGGTPRPFSLSGSGLSLKLNFSSTKSTRDSISITGSLPVPADFTGGAQSFAVFVGGAGAFGPLSAKGMYASIGKTTSFKVGKVRTTLGVRNAPFTAQLKGVFAANLVDEGIGNETVSKKLVNIPVYVVMGNQYLSTVATVSYSAKQGKTGSAKSAR